MIKNMWNKFKEKYAIYLLLHVHSRINKIETETNDSILLFTCDVM